MSKKKTLWHKGPPPSIGWWPSSTGRREGIFRWWNGKTWSHYATSNDTATFAGHQAQRSAIHQKLIEWKHRPDDWPARSRT